MSHDPQPGSRDQISRAIFKALVYSDVFDYPMTAEEVHRYLVGVGASRHLVEGFLNDGALLREKLALYNGHFALPGREGLFALRERREAIAAAKWRWARRYGRLIAHFPFVRMVAVTGALAMNNVEEWHDIDFLIVTVPGRLWLCRGLVVLLVRGAARLGHRLCPNFFLSERALVMEDRNLFAAHELVQMVPLYGMAVYRHMRQRNAWSSAYLPNARERPPWAEPSDELNELGRALKRFLEWALGGRIGAAVERFEMRRKVPKLSRQAGADSDPLAFTPDRCKGHFEGHGRRTMEEFVRRTRAYEDEL